jgi:hypothetical protein
MMTSGELEKGTEDTNRHHVLPSGRSVVVRLAGAAEEIEVRSPGGDVEVRITLTDSGPVVSVRAARLELDAAEEMTLNAKRLKVETTEGTELLTDGELRVRSEGEMHFNGKMINLNC